LTAEKTTRIIVVGGDMSERRNIYLGEGSRGSRLAELAAERSRLSALVAGLLGEASDRAVERWAKARYGLGCHEATDLVERAMVGGSGTREILETGHGHDVLSHVAHVAELAVQLGMTGGGLCEWLEKEAFGDTPG
jgi:hypothetical protein